MDPITETFTYDKLGNITNLGRMGSTLPIDALTFTYFGNQIIKVDDLFNSQNQYSIKEYQNKVNIPVEFIYDANGNMITDLDREIVTIKYNLLNLPELIQFKNGCQIKNTYSADGQQLSSRYVTVNAGVYQPLNPGQIIDNLDVNENDYVTVEGMDYIENIEYKISRYFDWDVTFEPKELKYLWYVHNPEGYVDNFTTSSQHGPAYNVGSPFLV